MSFHFDLNAIRKTPKLSKKESKILRDSYEKDVKYQDNSIFVPILPVEYIDSSSVDVENSSKASEKVDFEHEVKYKTFDSYQSKSGNLSPISEYYSEFYVGYEEVA